VDDNPETYWATDDATVQASLELTWDTEQTISYVLIQEYIKLGQRVKAFDVEVWQDDAWIKVAEATTIGYKRIVKMDPVATTKMRINFRDAKACPVISNVEIF
jgi:alpha-L-fucosidase